MKSNEQGEYCSKWFCSDRDRTWSFRLEPLYKLSTLLSLQTSLAVNELVEFTRATSSDCHQCTTTTTAGLIICGDFNSPPHTLPYQLMSRGHLDDVILHSLRNTCPFTQQVTTHLPLNQSINPVWKTKKLIKKQTYTKTETCKLYSRAFWIFLPNVIKIDLYNFELYRFKVGAFLRHSVHIHDVGGCTSCVRSGGCSITSCVYHQHSHQQRL